MKLTFFCHHPFDIVLFAGLANLLAEKGLAGPFRAIIARHRYANEPGTLDRILEAFDEVHHVSGTREFSKNIVLGFREARRLLKELRSIGIGKDETAFVAARSNLPALLFRKVHSDPSRIIALLQNNPVYENPALLNDEFVPSCFETVLRRIYELGLELPRSRAYLNKKAAVIHHYSYDVEPFPRVLFLQNRGEALKENEIHFPYVFPASAPAKESGKILFFGSRFLGWDYVDGEKAAAAVNRALRVIEARHPDARTFVYKPHPLETVEWEKLEKGRFTLEPRNITAEVLFALERNGIDAVYSIGSTSSKTAYNFGLNTYVFYPLFGFPDEVKMVFDHLFQSLPREAFIRTWDAEIRPDRLLDTPDIENLMSVLGR